MTRYINPPVEIRFMLSPFLYELIVHLGCTIKVHKKSLILDLFIPVILELREMIYQSENDYVFYSTKFTKRFPDFAITNYSEGIAASIDASQDKKAKL